MWTSNKMLKIYTYPETWFITKLDCRQVGKKWTFQQMVLENWLSIFKKWNQAPISHHNSKLMPCGLIFFLMKGKTKYLEDNLHKVLTTLKEGRDFFNIQLKPWKKLLIQWYYTTSVHQKTLLQNEMIGSSLVA